MSDAAEPPPIALPINSPINPSINLPIALSMRPHDRVAQRRVDDAWLERAWADPATRVLVLAGSRFRVGEHGMDWRMPADAPDGVRVLLGERDGAARFAVVADRSLASEDGPQEAWLPLRGALPYVDRIDAELVVHAVGIAEWLLLTRFCPRCGSPLEPRSAGHELACVNEHRQFPRTDPAVIMVVVDGPGDSRGPGDRVLLGRSPQWPEGRYSTLAGFVEPGETLEQAVRREVLEETGVRVGRVDYAGSQPWPLPASLMVGFVAHAESTEVSVDGEEIESARWFTRAEIEREASAGELILPGGISISHSLVEWWYGGKLPGSWR